MHLLHRCVSRVDYQVSIRANATIQRLTSIQMEFAGHHPPASDGIQVELSVKEMPDLSSWQVLISSGPGWGIHQRDNERCLCLGSPTAIPQTGLTACWDRDASRATVYCGSEWVREGPDGLEMRYTAGYPVDQILFMYYLASRQGLLVHAAGLVRDGRALLFPGVSGAGKSTLSRQFLTVGDPGLLSDDRIIVRWLDDVWQAFGTPWPGDAGIAVNAGAPLGAILFPAKASETSIRALSPQEALDRLLPATSILWHEPELLTDQLATTERLLREIPAFELAWSLEKGVVDDVREFVSRL